MKQNVATRRTLLGQGINSFVWTLSYSALKFYHQQNNVVDNTAYTLTADGVLYTEPKYSGYQAGVISGSFGMSVIGQGIMVLAHNMTYTGTTTVFRGSTLSIGNGGQNGALTGALVLQPGSQAIFNRNISSITYGGVISGTGSVILRNTAQVSGNGGYAFSGANTNTGGIIIERGARLGVGTGQGTVASLSTNQITVNAGSQFYNAGVTVTNNLTISGEGWSESVGILGALRYQFAAVMSGNINVVSAATIRNYNTSSDTLTLSGILSGTAPMTFDGNGTVYLTGNNTALNTTINVVGGSTLSAIDGSATMNYVWKAVGTSIVNIASGSTFIADNSTGTNYNIIGGNFFGTGTLGLKAQSASQRTTVTGNTLDNLTGVVSILSNNIQLVGTNTTANVNIASAAYLVLWSGSGAEPKVGALTGTGVIAGVTAGNSGPITIGNGNKSGTFPGTIINFNGPIVVTKIGTGTQVLTGANTSVGNYNATAGISSFQNTNAWATTIVSIGATVSGGTSQAGNIKALTFNGLTSQYNVYAILPTSASKLTCTTLTATSGFTINVLGTMNAGTYPILVSTTGTPTPTLGTNTTGRTVTFAWAGQTLNMILV